MRSTDGAFGRQIVVRGSSSAQRNEGSVPALCRGATLSVLMTLVAVILVRAKSRRATGFSRAVLCSGRLAQRRHGPCEGPNDHSRFPHLPPQRTTIVHGSPSPRIRQRASRRALIGQIGIPVRQQGSASLRSLLHTVERVREKLAAVSGWSRDKTRAWDGWQFDDKSSR